MIGACIDEVMELSEETSEIPRAQRMRKRLSQRWEPRCIDLYIRGMLTIIEHLVRKEAGKVGLQEGSHELWIHRPVHRKGKGYHARPLFSACDAIHHGPPSAYPSRSSIVTLLMKIYSIDEHLAMCTIHQFPSVLHHYVQYILRIFVDRSSSIREISSRIMLYIIFIMRSRGQRKGGDAASWRTLHL